MEAIMDMKDLGIESGTDYSQQVMKSSQLDALKTLALLLLREVDLVKNSEGIKFYKGQSKGPIDLFEEMRLFEITLIRSAMIRCGGNQSKAAKLLGIKPTTLNEKIRRHKIDLGI